MPATDQQTLSPVTGCTQRNAQIAGYRVVNGGHQGQAHSLNLQHAPTQALVIVNQVVVVAVFAQVLHRPTAKGVRLCKAACELAQPLDNIAVGSQMTRAQGKQPVLEQVETGNLNQPDSRV